MDIKTIKQVIIDQKEEIDDFWQREKIIDRDIDTGGLKHFLRYPNILVISGIRRCGKSTLSQQLVRGNRCGYLNFDDERLAGFTRDDFNETVGAFYEIYGKDLGCFMFDEIQNISGWELFANRLRRNNKIIITGSNANLLSVELSTHLTGRYVDFTLYPFSFGEFLRWRGFTFEKIGGYSTKSIAQIKGLLDDYIEIGGLPEVFKFGKATAGKIYDDIISKDILLRYNIRHKKAFKEMANYLLSSFGQEVGYAKLAKIFAIKNVHTIKNYVDYLHSSFLTFSVERFSFRLKQQVIAPKKIFGIDTGIINFLAFQFSANTGRLMENAVFMELLRRRSYGSKTFDVFYWHDHGDREVDFVIKEKKRITQLIQVCLDLTGPNAEKRETLPLIKAGDELRCGNLLLITRDEEGEKKIKGKKIAVIPLWKWLLDYKNTE